MNEINLHVWRGRMSELCRAVTLALLLFTVTGAMTTGSAETKLNEKNRAIKIKLDEPMNTETSNFGDPFAGTIVETYRLGNRLLPKGTIVKGQVKAARPSMLFGLPGYVSVDIQEARLPSGDVFDFDTTGARPRTQKYHHPKAPTIVGITKAAIPYGLLSAVDSVPLTLATSMTSAQIFPITLASRIAVGIGWELKHRQTSPMKNYPIQTRIGYGMIRGTGLNGAYQMITTAQEPDLRKGSVIAIQLPEKDMTQLFVAGIQSEEENSDMTAQGNPAKTAPITDPLPRPQVNLPQAENETDESKNIPAITLPPEAPSPTTSAFKPEPESSQQ